MITAGLCADAGCRCSEAVCVRTCTERGTTNTSRGRTGLHRHTAHGDQGIAVFIHRIAADSDCTRTDGLCVLAKGRCVLTGRKRIQADGGCAICNRIRTAAEGRCTVADGVGCLAGSRGVVTFDIGTGVAVVTAAGLEIFVGCRSHRRHFIQLRSVHRIGGFGACSDVGDLAFGTFTAHRYAVGTISNRVGTQRHAVGGDRFGV
ncbi:hypothetical protein D3C81_988480 [compost metagenome]